MDKDISKKLISSITEAANIISKKSREGYGNFIITSSTISNALLNILPERKDIRKEKINKIIK